MNAVLKMKRFLWYRRYTAVAIAMNVLGKMLLPLI
jgi:hypothetical protein